jgi:riboflavin-specific deaminase-like protein
MRHLLPEPAAEVTPEEAYAVGLPAPGTSFVRANMVQSLDGSVTDAEGLSGGLSGPADKAVFRVLRAQADAVLVGAGTARAEGYRPAKLPVVLVSKRLALELTTPLFTETADGPNRCVVVTSHDADPARVAAVRELADVITVGTGDIDLTAAVDALRERGLRHLICEGGPSLLGSMLRAGLVDELCLTTSPMVVGRDSGRIVTSAEGLPGGSWAVTTLLEQDGFLFSRWAAPRDVTSD